MDLETWLSTHSDIIYLDKRWRTSLWNRCKVRNLYAHIVVLLLLSEGRPRLASAQVHLHLPAKVEGHVVEALPLKLPRGRLVGLRLEHNR